MTSIILSANSRLVQPLSVLPSTLADGEVLMVTGCPRATLGTDVMPEDLRNISGREVSVAARSLTGRRLLRLAAGTVLGIPGDEVVIAVDPHGKPYLSNSSHHVGISHSGDTVGIVIASMSVGLDLEYPRKIDAKGLARRFFSPEESEAIAGTIDESLFFEFWTRREAAIKADGRGLGKALSVTKVLANAPGEGERGGIRQVIIGEDLWQTLHWIDHGGLHGALAFPTIPSSILWCDLRGTDIL